MRSSTTPEVLVEKRSFPQTMEPRFTGSGRQTAHLHVKMMPITLLKGQPMTPKPSATLPGTVEKIIKPPHPSAPEKAQIAVEGADHFYKELRIENNLIDENEKEVRLKQGAKVDVTVEADPEATVAKP